MGGAGRAIALAWVCDDSFISFRYAGNLIYGHGLVYNAGERVEGYSNLLWTLLVALLMRAGIDPIRAAQTMGIASYCLLVSVLAGWSWRRAKRERAGTGASPRSSLGTWQSGAALPVAAMVALVAQDFHVWATGGLETMFFSFLGVAAILATRLAARPGRDWCVGGLLALLVLTRPDGLLYAPAALVSLWLATLPGGTGNTGSGWLRPTKDRLRAVTRAVVPLAAALAALVAWKLGYYGELLPTAFYSKSAASPYYVQGFLYLGLYLAKSWFLLPALVVVPWLARRERRRRFRPSAASGDGGVSLVADASPDHATAGAPASSPATSGTTPASEHQDRIVFLATAGLLLAYVLHSGGDFMFARRIVPVAPFLLLALESWIVSIGRAVLRWALAIALVAGAAVPYPVFGEGRWRISGIAEEPHFYPPEAIAARRAQGELMAEILGETPVRAMFEGGMCMFAYYSKLPYLVEMTGLTQYSLARLPIEERGTIGHEKRPDDRWLEENEIHLLFAQEWPISAPPPGGRQHDQVYFGNLARAAILLYSDAVMDSLRDRPGVSFIPIERVIERLRGEIENAPYQRAAAILDYLDRYYLRTAGPRGTVIREELLALIEAKQR